MLKKLRDGIKDLYNSAKEKVSNVKLPKRNKDVEVEWKDGIPHFHKKGDKKK